MTKIILSTGDKYIVNTPPNEIIERSCQDEWVFIEDDSRDIAIRSSHIAAIEEDFAALIKEAEKRSAT